MKGLIGKPFKSRQLRLLLEQQLPRQGSSTKNPEQPLSKQQLL
jgi:hypothetical protein